LKRIKKRKPHREDHGEDNERVNCLNDRENFFLASVITGKTKIHFSIIIPLFWEKSPKVYHRSSGA
jgi:hypothetical protein